MIDGKGPWRVVPVYIIMISLHTYMSGLFAPTDPWHRYTAAHYIAMLTCLVSSIHQLLFHLSYLVFACNSHSNREDIGVG